MKYLLNQTKNCLVISGIIAFFSLLVLAPAALALSVVQNYPSSGNIQTGMILSLGSGQTGTVSPTTNSDIGKMFGVAVSPDDTSAILSTGSTNSQPVYVATSGDYQVIVSNQNGAIKVGDYITASSLNGVGMNDGTTQSMVVGKALSSFDGKTNVINTATLLNSAGKKITVTMSDITVDINIIRNPALDVAPDLPGFLEHITQTVTPKPVDAVRAYLSLVVLVITVIIVSIMLYSGVRSSIISIGRNPLSKRTIFAGLIGVVLAAVAIFIVGMFAVYLLLKL